MSLLKQMRQELLQLEEHSSLRHLPKMTHDGRGVIVNNKRMLNLSSDDYLGLTSNRALYEGFLRTLAPNTFLPSSSSSRLLTGNSTIYEELEAELSHLFNTEGALVFSSGYRTNTGILPAVSDAYALILTDKLVHASLINGIRLSAARYTRYRYNNLMQLGRLLGEHHTAHHRIIIATESIFSMDGDQADLQELTKLKHKYNNVLLYVGETHAFDVRGRQGLGCTEEFHCIHDIDFLVGISGKAAASVNAYIACKKVIREYLINCMRTLIFTTGPPPINIAWTLFVVRRLANMQERREHLAHISRVPREVLQVRGCTCLSVSHIVPMIVGPSVDAVLQMEALQRHGFYALSVRPPTVPEDVSRIHFSLTVKIGEEEIEELNNNISVHADQQ